MLGSLLTAKTSVVPAAAVIALLATTPSSFSNEWRSDVAISAAKAEQIAISNSPWAAPVVTGDTLVTALNPTPAIASATAWLISFDPLSIPAGPIGGLPRSATQDGAESRPANNFAIALVDGNSGEVLRIMNGYDPSY